MKPEYLGLALLVLVGGSITGLFLFSPAPMSATKNDAAGFPYREIVNPAGYVNTDSITFGELIGKKVILFDFMTYSCINCQRTFPYLNAWYEKYKDQGLEIIGIHTPEFAFERDINNVRKAALEFGLKFPLVLDNEYATWNAYGNRYWPRKYLIDIHGNVVYDHIGEGAYEKTERKIQELLAERARVLGESLSVSGSLAASDIENVTVAAQSPETYFGALRNERLGNGVPGVLGERTFALPGNPVRDMLYLGGVWNITEENAETVSEASLLFRFLAKEVYIVGDSDEPVLVEVLLDGMPVGSLGGADVGADGTVTVHESRLYKLIKLDSPEEHILELRVTGSGVRFYAFTFG